MQLPFTPAPAPTWGNSDLDAGCGYRGLVNLIRPALMATPPQLPTFDSLNHQKHVKRMVTLHRDRCGNSCKFHRETGKCSMLAIMISLISAHRDDIPPSAPDMNDDGNALLSILIDMFDAEENEMKDRKPSESRSNGLEKIGRYRKCLECNMKH
jgi:hypothetical protein